MHDRMLEEISGRGMVKIKRNRLNSQEPHRVHFASTAQILCIAVDGIVTHFLTAAV